MSLKAKGLYAFLMSKPDGWQTSVMGLVSQLQEGKDAIMGALAELGEHGYYKKERTRLANGTFVYSDYVYDQPCTDEPYAENPHAENPPQVNTDKVTTDKVKTELKTIDQEALRLALLLNTKVSEHYSFIKADEKTIDRWALDIERIHRIDKYSYDLIQGVIEWAQNDSFWRQNIRSGDKLRKQFTNLLIRIKEQNKNVEVIS